MPKSKELSISPSEPTVHLESLDDGAIAVLTLDDSKGTNVMSPEMGDVFSRHIAFILKDPTVKAVILRGAGKNFSIRRSSRHADRFGKSRTQREGASRFHAGLL
jgi:enoyl-CoA hydratase/carnithine racemase